jgi:3-demethoxyubiquinol 3-hydroxylase
MISDERQHGESAKQAGGVDLPAPIKFGMNLMSQVMKKTTYRI